MTNTQNITDSDKARIEANAATRYEEGFSADVNPFTKKGNIDPVFARVWANAYWAAYDVHATQEWLGNPGSIEEGYGNFSEVEQGHWDDDPSPYDGTYSEC